MISRALLTSCVIAVIAILHGGTLFTQVKCSSDSHFWNSNPQRVGLSNEGLSDASYGFDDVLDQFHSATNHQDLFEPWDIPDFTDASTSSEKARLECSIVNEVPEWSSSGANSSDLNEKDMHNSLLQSQTKDAPKMKGSLKWKKKTGPYAAELLSDPNGPGIVDYVRLYKKHCKAQYATAYYRVRSKLTKELAEWLKSDNDKLVKMAVDIIGDRRSGGRLTLQEYKILKRRMSPILKTLNIKGSDVQMCGLPLFPQDRLNELSSDDETVFTEALDLLLQCYRHAIKFEGRESNYGFADENELNASQIPALVESGNSTSENFEAELDAAFANLSEQSQIMADEALKHHLIQDYSCRNDIAMTYMRQYDCSMGTARNTIVAGLPLLHASECRQLIDPSVEVHGPAFATLRVLGNRAIANRKAILKPSKKQL